MLTPAAHCNLQVIQPPAAKADIWRLAIVLHYGGVYADSDVKALQPFRERVWPNASVVSGIGRGKDLHQWWSPREATFTVDAHPIGPHTGPQN